MLETFSRSVLQVIDEDLRAMRALPEWPARVAAALPDARIETLPRQRHIAHRHASERFAQRVPAFLAGPYGEGHPEALTSTHGRSRR